jgi:hypothetical protein
MNIVIQAARFERKPLDFRVAWAYPFSSFTGYLCSRVSGGSESDGWTYPGLRHHGREFPQNKSGMQEARPEMAGAL